MGFGFYYFETCAALKWTQIEHTLIYCFQAGADSDIPNCSNQTPLDLCKRKSVTANLNPAILKEIKFYLKGWFSQRKISYQFRVHI